MTQIIDLGKLRFSFAGEWSSSTTYEANDVVKYGGNIYVYTYGLKTSTNLPTNTVYWALMVEGFKFRGTYSTSTAYRIGDGIAYGGKVYIAVADTTNNVPPNTTYWSQFADGVQYEGDYSAVAQYQRNDMVKYGSSAYIAKLDTTGNLPTDETFWAKLVEGVSAAGAWSAVTAYVPNDLVAYGANQYKAIANNTNQLPINSTGALNTAYWAVQTEGVRSRGNWATTTEYYINDVVSHGGNSYICIVRNAATVFETDLAANKWTKFNGGIRWRSTWAPSISYLKDDVVKDAVGSAYIATQDHTSTSSFSADLAASKWVIFVLGGADVLPAIGATDAGQSLTVTANGTAINWIGATQSDNVFYVAPHGTNTATSGKNLSTPFSSIRYACDNAPAGSTIFVKTGTYTEQLPIIIPANTAIVGDSQRTVIVQPATGLSDDGVTPNAQASMFLMSDGSILNRMTFRGMTGWVPGSVPNDITTSVIKAVVVRLNPATPITHKSPYVLECSFIGSGAIGALVDGGVHTTGNKSIIFHAYTVISDNGVGYYVKDGGKSEIVSCFTYFCYFGYTASGGGFIRALNGNNSYGTWGATSRGFDASEVALTGTLVGKQLNFVYSGGNINTGDTVTSSSGAVPAVTYLVTTVPNPGGAGNIYQINGVNYPVLALTRGGVYTFDQSAASNVGHQIAFKDDTGASYTTGVVTTGTLGQAGAKTVFTVPNNAPADLRYYCVAHGNGMGNTITVSGSGAINGTLITGTATVINVQYSANKVYVKDSTGTFEPGSTLTFSSGGTGGVNPGGLEDQKGFVLVAKGFSSLPKPGSSIQLTGDTFAYVIQSLTGTYVDSNSELVFVLAQEKPTSSPAGTVVTIRTKYTQIRLTGHDFLSIGTGGTATTNYPGTPTQPPAQGNETDEAYPGRVYYVSTDQDGNFRVGEYFRIDQATGRATLNANAFDLAGLTSLRLGSIGAQLGETINEFSSDATLLDNSNIAVPTEYAVKTYVDTRVPQALPTSVGQTGKYLASTGSTTAWQTLESFPDQTYSNSGILFTDGIAPYWGSFTRVTGQNTFSFVAGAAFPTTTYTASSQVNASPTFTWTVTPQELPPGITNMLVNSSGALSMTGTFTTTGSYNLTVSATDNRGVIGRLRVRVVVAATNIIPVFSNSGDTVTTELIPGSSANITSFQATNTGGGIVYAFVGGGYPSWVTLNTSTGALTGTVTNLTIPQQRYNFTISATAGGVTVLKTFNWNLTIAFPSGQALFGVNVGTGDFTWVAPAGVTSVSVVAVGSGSWGGWEWSSGGQGGGGLAWRNDIPVVPGTSYLVRVAGFGTNGGNSGSNTNSTHSFFISEATVCGRSSQNGNGGSFTAPGGGGGSGGNGGGGSWPTGGGGAGGYAGAGGAANANTSAPAGGGGQGSYSQYSSTYGTGGGGGVGLLGQGASGSGWNPTGVGGAGGGGGSGGAAGTWGETGSYGNNSCRGGDYGGGGGGSGTSTSNNSPYSLQARGGQGGVRIIWGPGRAFPATNTADV